MDTPLAYPPRLAFPSQLSIVFVEFRPGAP